MFDLRKEWGRIVDPDREGGQSVLEMGIVGFVGGPGCLCTLTGETRCYRKESF